MDIVVLDGRSVQPGDLSWSELEALGALTVYDHTPDGEIAARIGAAPCVFINKVPITGEILDRCPDVRFIGVLATGYNTVDIAAARARAVTVCNVPTYGTASVAQFVFALLLEICHRAALHDTAVQEGAWSRSTGFSMALTPLIELAGKTMGIVGFGRIGRAVAGIAMAMGMRVVYYDPAPAVRKGCEAVSLEDLCARADVITLHCPLTADTAGIIRRDTIDRMKNGVILINTARGGLVAEADLAAAVTSGKVYAAAVDVVSSEPISPGNPLMGVPGILITPHIAWAPREARARLIAEAAHNLAMFLAGTPINTVT